MHIRKFLQHLEKNGTIFRGLSEVIELPRVEQRLPKAIMTPTELEKFFSVADLKTGIGYRNRAIMEVLYSSGLRVSELCNLRLHDVNTVEGEVKVFGKGSKERNVPIGQVACGYLREYILKIRPRLENENSDGRIFLSQTGRPMTRKKVADFFRRYREVAGLNKQVTPHTLRHQAATDMHRNGADIRHIQSFLGHARLDTTQVYTKVDITDLKAVHQKCHSREKSNSQAKPFNQAS